MDFKDLLKTNGALAFALANVNELMPGIGSTTRLALVDRIIPRRRREIAQALGFPSESVRTLGRIEPTGITVQTLQAAQALFSDLRTVRLWSHRREITPQMIEAAHLAPDICSPMMISQLDGLNPRDRFWIAALGMIQNCHNRGLLRDFGVRIPLDGFEDLQKAWHRCREGLAWIDNTARIAAVPQPVSGTWMIQPLSSVDDFLAEAREMKHCILNEVYLERLLNGQSYFFRTVSPPLQRATVELAVVGRIRGEPLLSMREMRGRPLVPPNITPPFSLVPSAPISH